MRMVVKGHPGPSRIDIKTRRTRGSEMLGLARAAAIEGFDTADLKDAKALLDELNA
jgi:hypothetical protein